MDLKVGILWPGVGRAFAFLQGPLQGASVLDSQTGAQLLPPKHHLLFNISILSPEQMTPMVTISVKTSKTYLRSVLVLHPQGSEFTKPSDLSTVGSKGLFGGHRPPCAPGITARPSGKPSSCPSINGLFMVFGICFPPGKFNV